ncbi:MAG: ATP-binding protein [Thermoplasmata archaeon]
MKEIVVVSGKGGTGKTTVLARYAEIANNAVIADCDVDAPNLHMLLNPKMRHREAFVGSKMAVVDHDKCTNCGKCEGLCRFDAISTVDDDGRKRVDIDIDSCEGCGICARVCPEDAIDLRDRIVGEWFVSDTDYGTMIHALLEPGAENSGKLVAMVKHEAKMTAKENGAKLVLVDGPPGIGCPVIAALSGTNIVVIVAEPTVSGLSDFRRVADLAGGFGIKCALLVNKADLNYEMTASLLEEATKREMPCIGRIPYDEELMAAMAKGAEAATEYQGCPAIIEISKTYDALLGLL